MVSTKLASLFTAAIWTLSSSVHAANTGNCTRFDWDQQPLYLVHAVPVRISAAKSCPQSAQNATCLVTAEGDEQFRSTRNISGLSTFVIGTLMDPFVDSINAAIVNALSTADLGPTSFNNSVIAPIDQTRTIEPGRTAYLNFTALRFCFTGRTESCTGDVENGTPIEVCAPLWRRTSKDARTTVDGEYELVYIDAENAANFTNPYKGQSSGNEVGDEGAASMVRAVPSLLGLVFVMCLMFVS